MTTRRLAAILAADVVGFSSMMEKDEEGTLRLLKTTQRDLIEPRVREHHGRIVKTTGDGFLIEFGSPLDAVRCALEVQDAVSTNGVPGGSEGALRFRMGINLGDIIIEEDGDIYGDGVNVAARLEQLGEPGSVCISGKVFDEIEGKLQTTFGFTGEHQVKNIIRPVRVYSSRRPPGPNAQANSLPLPNKPSIAVLPFNNMSDEPSDQYFADGITEDLITALTRVRWVHVAARNSVFGYKRKAQDIRQVARDLQATYMLEGSVRRDAGRIRLTAQLVDGTSGKHIWAKRYDRSLEDIFAVQDDLTESIFAAVVPELDGAERDRARAKRPESLTAWDCYQRGLWHLYRRTSVHVAQAERLFERALELDGNLVPALCALAEAHFFQGFFFFVKDVATHSSEAMRLAERAVELDHQDPAAYCALARAHMMSGNHSAGVSFAETALSLNPTSARAQYLLGICHTYDGRPREGLPHIELAIKLSPYDDYAGRFMAAAAEANLFLGEYEKAAEWGGRALRQPRSGQTSRRQPVYAAALGHLGRIEEARQVVRDLLRDWPNFTIGLLCQSLPPTDPDNWSRYAEGLRKAGLPE